MRDRIKKILKEELGEDDFSWMRQPHLIDRDSVKRMFDEKSDHHWALYGNILDNIMKMGLTDAQIPYLIDAMDYFADEVAEDRDCDDERSEAYDEGYEEGHDSGYDQGRDSGYDDGCDECGDERYDVGYEEGRDNGDSEGYDRGYEEGCEECGDE